MTDGSYLVWCRRAMWLDIVVNVVVALVNIACTSLVLEGLGLPSAVFSVGPHFAAFHLILLSGFYLPATIDWCGTCFRSSSSRLPLQSGALCSSSAAVVASSSVYWTLPSACPRLFFWHSPWPHPGIPRMQEA